MYPVPWRRIGQRMHTRTARRCGADLRRVTMWWPPMCAGSRLSRAVGIVMRWLADRAADVVVLRFNGLNPASSLAASNHSGHLLVEPLVARTELPCNEVRHCTPPACRGTDGTRAVYRDRRVGKHPLSPVRPRPRPPRPRQRPDLAIQPEQRGLHAGAGVIACTRAGVSPMRRLSCTSIGPSARLGPVNRTRAPPLTPRWASNRPTAPATRSISAGETTPRQTKTTSPTSRRVWCHLS